MTRRQGRGRLRVYLGAAPGVGKTYAMLAEAHRRAERGTDVVVGIVETHGRARTAEALGDLEVVPRRLVDHRGTSHTELDLDAVLVREPDVVLVDELAHTNVPGSGHEKRWQDVETILAGGIDVVTTVNVQHLESLNDVVEAITGVRQRETVPDAFVRAADAIELVDMSPQSLRRRMAHGNVYPADRVDAALSKYFREGNLAALRELALLWLADRVDEGLEAYRSSHEIDSTWATRERVVVAVTGGPESETLLRRAARIASRTAGGEWLAVYVARRDGLVGAAPDVLARQHRIIGDMGGTFHTVVSDDVPTGILQFARAENATQILIGASRRGRVSALLRPGVGETVIARADDADVHVVAHDYARGRGADPRRSRASLGRRRTVAGYALGLVGPFALTGLLRVTADLHGLPSEALAMMALVVATALVGGLVPALLGAVLSGVLLNVAFTPPVGTLAISDPENVAAIVVFLVVGAAVASVVDLAARRSAQALRAGAEADALAVLAHSLLHAGDDLPELLAQATEVFGMQGAAIVSTSATDPSVLVSHGDAPGSVAQSDVDVPIDDATSLVLRGRTLEAADRRLVTAYAAHAAVVMQRRATIADTLRARELTEGNRVRTALLAAVSHDLRSPLAATKAAVSSLRSDEIAWSPDDEAELLRTIEESTDRLDSLVGNLLDLSRLETGVVRPQLAEVDLLAVARSTVATVTDPTRFSVVESDAPTGAADPGLLDRVVANVCENALTHTPPGPPIELLASDYRDDDGRHRVTLRVVDHGPGVPAAQAETIFAPFQRLGDVPAGDGVGLGLAVARGLTEAMGGTLTADDTPGGGLTMVVELPVWEDPS
ncbi:ATP-binding protein [Solicola sp. PLA-1-18]|uniref:ATP-binding protein n=1 Tax=Solicola sp. PLA-1-18 TaxID=3380532 RepID=UPI003B7C1CD3